MDPYELTDWKRIFFGEVPGHFLVEVAGRTLIMFSIVFIGLRATGKTTVRQLTVVDLVLIIGLGSAAGDPMFYHDVGLLPALLVFVIIVLIYRGINRFSASSQRASDWVQGRTVLLVEDGVFAIDEFKKENMGQDEFFMELREGGVEHLGQVRKAYLESSGNVSLFYFEDEQVQYGLPVLPELFGEKREQLPEKGVYACSFCGHIETLKAPVPKLLCPRCNHHQWVKALKNRRVT